MLAQTPLRRFLRLWATCGPATAAARSAVADRRYIRSQQPSLPPPQLQSLAMANAAADDVTFADTERSRAPVACGTTPTVFYDSSLAHEAAGSPCAITGEGGGEGRSNLRRRRRASRRTSEIPSDELRTEQRRLLALMNRAAMEDPQCIHYALHTFPEISPAIARSIAAHHLFFDYVSVREDANMRRHFARLEDGYKAEILGKAMYLRIVNVTGGDGPSSQTSAHARAIHAGVMKVVRDYSRETLEPFPGEICCDVSHYAALAPLVAAAKVNVEQFVLDARSLIEKGMVAEKGVPGKPTPARRLQPLSPEDVAKEMASRITREVLRPLGQQYQQQKPQQQHEPLPSPSPQGKDGVEVASTPDPLGGFRVCIGIAMTPVLAKIGCDAEVLHVQGRGAAGGKGAAVRVRSFYQHIRTLRDSKNFMAHFRVAHVPVLTPAFAKFLQAVFRIDTCSQLYERREELYFNLSRETFNVCYGAVFGRMRFPQEAQHALVSTENLKKSKHALEVLATNAIALANEDRTAIRASALKLTSAAVRAAGFATLDARRNYGRLFTDAQFKDVVLQTTQKVVRRLQSKGFTCGGMRVDLRRGLDVHFVVSKSFPPTHQYAELMAYGREVAEALAPHRQHKGIEATGGFFCVTITLTALDVARMAPARLEAEVDLVKTAYRNGRLLLSKGRRAQYLRPPGNAARGTGEVCRVAGNSGTSVALTGPSRGSSRRARCPSKSHRPTSDSATRSQRTDAAASDTPKRMKRAARPEPAKVASYIVV